MSYEIGEEKNENDLPEYIEFKIVIDNKKYQIEVSEIKYINPGYPDQPDRIEIDDYEMTIEDEDGNELNEDDYPLLFGEVEWELHSRI